MNSAEVLAHATSENELLATVCEFLTLYKWRWHHVRRSDKAIQQGAPGFPDILAVRGREMLAIELKTEAGRMGPGQHEWLLAFEDAGCFGFVVRPSTLDAFLAKLR